MINLILRAVGLLPMAGLLALMLAGNVQAGQDCGGLNQKSCWHIDPNKWCKGDLKYKPTGVPGKGTCVKRTPKPKPKPKKECGGLNQSSCWHADPTKWCKGDLQYKPTGVPGKGTCVKRQPKPQKECGGLNQSSCWHADPTKWCTGDLQYKPTGVPGQGTCVVRKEKQCGNLNQASCWHVNPAKWCNGDLKYKPTGIPGQGRCILRVSNNDLKDVAGGVVARLKSIGENNPLTDLRNCLLRPENHAELKEALGRQSANGVNTLIRHCGVSPDELRRFGESVLGASNSQTTMARGHTRSRSSSGSDDDKAWHLSIGGSGSGVAYVGFEGGVGYRIGLEKNPEARFYVTGGLSIGVGLAAGADVAVGLSYERMPTEHWARDPGASVSYSGKFAYGGGVAVDFAKDSLVPSGFTLSGGIGGGAEAGVVTGSVDQYLYNF